MTPTMIRIILKSAATFGRGDGVPGLVDREIEHDAHGFPFLRGKTLKGLLVESAENIVFALNDGKEWRDAKNLLFGVGGRGTTERGALHVGDAQLPQALRAEIIRAAWKPEDVLYSLTGIRRQTAINPDGAPDHATLRSMRVLLRGVVLEAVLNFDEGFDENQYPKALPLLAAAVLEFRRAGTGRNRGRGWLKAELDDDSTTKKLFEEFQKAVPS